MDKKAVDTMEYYSAIKKNAFESVLMRWMELEPIIHTVHILLSFNNKQYSFLEKEMAAHSSIPA